MSTTPSPSPTRITTAEELDALPDGSVVLSDAYLYPKSDERVVFQRVGLDWGRPFRSADTHPEYIVPATVLHTPAAPPVSDTAAPTITPEQYEAAWNAAGTVALPGPRYLNDPQAHVVAKAVIAALGLTATDKADQ